MTDSTNEPSDLQRGVTVVGEEPEPIERGRSLIVVIGINEYVHQQKLKNAVQDAIGLQQALIDKLGFSAPIQPLLDEAATRGAIFSLIEDGLYEVVEENDSLIVFFAGHGQTRVRKVGDQTIETGYLIPVDAAQSWSDYIEIDPFLRGLSALPARHILVILDSCHSGFALGQAMQSFRDTARYEKDLSSRISRKVITSAQQDQLALDGGPVSGHSLFTGTLIDGFNWGKADLDGNGLISSSELGLFIQQQVAQASRSKQTPDFGSFHLDDRGEMVISLRNQSFDALKARAYSALQNGEFKIFKERVEQLIALNPSSPETLYLEYRLRFLENDFQKGSEVIDALLDLNPSRGLIPLSQQDLWDIKWQLHCWVPVLSISEISFPLEVEVLVRNTLEEPHQLEKAKEIKIGDIPKGHLINCGKVFQLNIKNPTDVTIHVYMIKIGSNGCFEPLPLWSDEDTLLDGLPPKKTKLTYPFVQTGCVGTREFRLFSSPKRLRFFLFPASPDTKGAYIEKIFPEDLVNIRMKSVVYRDVFM